MFTRIGLFLATNIAILAVLSISMCVLVAYGIAAALMTHPPLERRILALKTLN